MNRVPRVLLAPLALSAGFALAFIFGPNVMSAQRGSLVPAAPGEVMMLAMPSAAEPAAETDRCGLLIRAEDYKACCVDTFVGRQCCEFAEEKGITPPPGCASVPTLFLDAGASAQQGW